MRDELNRGGAHAVVVDCLECSDGQPVSRLLCDDADHEVAAEARARGISIVTSEWLVAKLQPPSAAEVEATALPLPAALPASAPTSVAATAGEEVDGEDEDAGDDPELAAALPCLPGPAAQEAAAAPSHGDEELAAGLNGLASRMRTLGWTCGHLATSLRGFRPWKHPHAAEKQGTVGLYADVFGFLHARLDCTHEQQMQMQMQVQMQMQMQIHTQQQMQQPGGEGDAEAAPTPASGTSPPPTAASLAASHSPPLDGTPLTRTLEEASAPQPQRPPEEDEEEERLEQQPATPAAAAAPPAD